jgi:tetrahydromethanopterin S-methyltransferase subunit F
MALQKLLESYRMSNQLVQRMERLLAGTVANVESTVQKQCWR